MNTRSVSPAVWGPAGWRFLHAEAAAALKSAAAAAAGVDVAVEDFRTLIDSLRVLLPCPTCRENFASHLATLPFPEKASELPRWVFRLHHRVNRTRPGVDGAPRRPPRAGEGIAAPWTPADIAPFVAAIVETHPGGRAVLSSAYLKALEDFTKVLATRTGTTAAPAPSVLLSRVELRNWFRSWKKNVAMGAIQVGVCKFTSAC